MPVHVEKKGRGKKPYAIVETATGNVKGRSTSRAKAKSSARARNAAAHGFEPSGKPRHPFA